MNCKDEINEGIIKYLEKIEDPRADRGIRYRLSDILFMVLHAGLCGHYNSIDIKTYCDVQEEKFKKILGIKRIPSHDTFSRIMRMVDLNKLVANIGDWISQNFPELYKEYKGKRVMHIDGKAIRAAAETSKGEKPVYLINSMYEGGSISLYTNKIGEKENENSMIPKYLEQFDLKDTIVTIDAIGTNQKIIEMINKKGGNYLLQVKENQKNLLAVIKNKVKELEETGKFKQLDSTSKIVKEHGRIEEIKTTIIKDTAFVYEELGLKSFYGTIARVGVLDKKVSKLEKGEYVDSTSRTYLITDLEDISVENMETIKLSHWNIEMQHWILDVQLNEDRNTSRKNNAPANMSVIKRFVIRINNVMNGKNMTVKKFIIINSMDFEGTTSILMNSPNEPKE